MCVIFRQNALLAMTHTHKISLLLAPLACTGSQSSNPAVYLCKEMFLKTPVPLCRPEGRTMILGLFFLANRNRKKKNSSFFLG